MNFEKSIKHLKWRFGQDRITIGKKDIEALNEIIKSYNETETKTLNSQKLFIKLFLDNFLKQTSIHGRTSNDAISEIKRLLAIPVSEYYAKMKQEVPFLRFLAIVEKNKIKPLYEVDGDRIKFNNSDHVIESNRKIIKKNQQLLKQALTQPYTDKELKDFLDSKLFKIILDYSKFD